MVAFIYAPFELKKETGNGKTVEQKRKVLTISALDLQEGGFLSPDLHYNNHAHWLALIHWKQKINQLICRGLIPRRLRRGSLLGSTLPLWISWLICRTEQTPGMPGVISASLALHISGLFTTMMAFTEMVVLQGILWAVTLAYIFKKSPHFLCQWRYKWLPPIGFFLGLCLFILANGIYFRLKYPTDTHFFNIGHRPAVIISPQKMQPIGILVYHLDENETMNDLARSTLRYFAEKGFIVITAQASRSTSQRPSEVMELDRWIRRQEKWALLPLWGGTKFQCAKFNRDCCLNFEYKWKGIAVIGSAYHWDNEEESPATHLLDLSCPILIIHGQHNFIIPHQEANDMLKPVNDCGSHMN